MWQLNTRKVPSEGNVSLHQHHTGYPLLPLIRIGDSLLPCGENWEWYYSGSAFKTETEHLNGSRNPYWCHMSAQQQPTDPNHWDRDTCIRQNLLITHWKLPSSWLICLFQTSEKIQGYAWRTPSFCSSNTCILRAYSLPGSVLGIRDREENNLPDSMQLTFSCRLKGFKQTNQHVCACTHMHKNLSWIRK